MEAGSAQVSINFRYTLGDYLLGTLIGNAVSFGNAAFGSFITTAGVVLLLQDNPSGWVSVLIGATVLSGIYTVPFTWLAVRQRRDLFLGPRHVAIDSSGLRVESDIAKVEQTWATFRRVQQRPDGFVLDYGAGVALLIPNHALGAHDAANLRQLADRAGKLDTSPPLQRAVRGVLVGCAALIATIAVVVAIAILLP